MPFKKYNSAKESAGKPMTEEQALARLTALCASAEHCTGEMIDKMTKWEIPEEAQARIMEHLVSNKYVDDERYCRAFVHDKMEYNHWGRRKIEQALYVKHVDKAIQTKVLDEIPDSDFISILRPLLDQKRRQTRADNDYEMNIKLMRFAASRGFTIDQIRQCIEEVDC
ncbi:MAG: regulatory protein RecX [Prevotella sp.]|nr:regulatory protein RecX [Prevotella sp.]